MLEFRVMFRHKALTQHRPGHTAPPSLEGDQGGRAVSAGRGDDTSTGRNSRLGGNELPKSAGRGTGRDRGSEHSKGDGNSGGGEEAEVGVT